MRATIRRDKTNNKDQWNCHYTVTLLETGEQINKGQDKWLWKKFMPGQLQITAEVWYNDKKELIIGKVITKEESNVI